MSGLEQMALERVEAECLALHPRDALPVQITAARRALDEIEAMAEGLTDPRARFAE